MAVGVCDKFSSGRENRKGMSIVNIYDFTPMSPLDGVGGTDGELFFQVIAVCLYKFLQIMNTD